MEEITIREPEQICQGCARKVLPVIRSPMVQALLGYFLREEGARPEIAELRLTWEGRIVARLEGAGEFGVDWGARESLIRAIHTVAARAALDGDERGFLLAQVAKIRREE